MDLWDQLHSAWKWTLEAFSAQHDIDTNDTLFAGAWLSTINASVTFAQQRLPRNDASLLLADMLVLC